MIVRKSASEIEIMREAGRVSARALRLVGEAVAVGVSTLELDEIAENAIRADGGAPAFKGYHGFPKTLCTSINNQVVHGIPSESVTLRDGDILSVDVGAVVDGLTITNGFTSGNGGGANITAGTLRNTILASPTSGTGPVSAEYVWVLP